MLRNWIIAATVAVAGVGFAGVPALAGSGPGGSGNAEMRVEGTLVGVTAGGQVAIRQANGTVVTLALNPTTKIERNGQQVPLAAFKLGDRAQARIVNGVVFKFEAVGP